MNLLKKSRILFFLLFVVLIHSCTENNVDESVELERLQYQQEKIEMPELYAPNFDGEVITYRGKNFDFSYERIDNKIIFEGDIVLSEDELIEMETAADDPSRAAFHSHEDKRWKKNIVPFEISDPSLAVRAMFAMNSIENNTNIVFEPRNPVSRNHKDFIRFVVGEGCSSAVGRQGGCQKITLSPACSNGNTLHEVCHALGMWHEQSRMDRDDFILIHKDNIQDGKCHNFEQNNCTVDVGNFDFSSVMMYSPCAFSTACPPGTSCRCTAEEATITRLDGTLYTISRVLSTTDIDAIDEIYPPHPCTNTPCCGVTCIPGYTCINGDCVIDIANPPGCLGDEGCPDGFSCIGGDCIPQ